MNARKIAAGVAFALALHGAAALAEGAGREPSRVRMVPASPRAVVPLKSGAKAQKAPAVRRTPARDRSTDFEMPQLG